MEGNKYRTIKTQSRPVFTLSLKEFPDTTQLMSSVVIALLAQKSKYYKRLFEPDC